MSDSVSYQEIHAYMLKKTSEYYRQPPAALVEAIQEEHRKDGVPISYGEAEQLVTPLQIQRFVKAEMQEKWPEFMASIPSNPLRIKD